MHVLLIILAFGTILSLSAYALFLHRQLNKIKHEQTKKQATQNALILQKRQESLESIKIIARAFQAEQVELAEASIRINHLLKFVDLSDEQRNAFKIFEKVNTELSHIPILKDWKALPNKEKAQHLKTIDKTENDYKDFVAQAMTGLLEINEAQPE